MTAFWFLFGAVCLLAVYALYLLSKRGLPGRALTSPRRIVCVFQIDTHREPRSHRPRAVRSSSSMRGDRSGVSIRTPHLMAERSKGEIDESVLSAPVRIGATASLETYRIRGLVMKGDVTFRNPDLRSCTCKGSVTVWGQCGFSGAAAYVMHARYSREEYAIKVYAPGSKVRPDIDILEAIQKKIDTFGNDTYLVKGNVFREGVTIEVDEGSDRVAYTFDVVQMPWYGSKHLGEFLKDNLDSRDHLIALMRELRSAFTFCADHGVAHGDLTTINVVVKLRDGRVELRLVDTDTLCWEGQIEQTCQSKGYRGYSTKGREIDPRNYVTACAEAGKIHMIDVPSQLILYLSVLAYVVAQDSLEPLQPRSALAFESGRVLADPEKLDRRVAELRAILQPKLATKLVVNQLLDDLKAHAHSSLGIDLNRESPFVNKETRRRLEHLENDLLGSTFTGFEGDL